MLSTEFVVLFSGLLMASMLAAQKIVGPLVDAAARQAALNAQTADLIAAAMAACGG